MQIKTEPKIHNGLNIYNHTFLYTAYADDTSFFLRDVESAREVINIFNVYSNFSGLYPNMSKCEIAGIGIKKGVYVALCGMKCVDLTAESIKILGVHFSYNKKLQNDLNFCDTVKNISKVLRLWRMRNLSLEGKITIFKSLAVSKIVYLALFIPIPKNIIDEINRIQTTFLWNNGNLK